MPIAIRAHGVSPGANTTTCVITKPVGLTVGDYMVGHITFGLSSTSITPPPGAWTLLISVSAPTGIVSTMDIWYKVAESADVSASTFTFTNGASGSNIGAITAFTGVDPNIGIDQYLGQANASGATVTAPSVTPGYQNEMILFFVTVGDNLTTTGYSIPTNNPAWTERYDINTISGTDTCAAMAWALRQQTTPTGNGTATISLATENIGAFVTLIPIPEAFPQAVFESEQRYNTLLRM